jgi:long-chain fatty acid transport protein
LSKLQELKEAESGNMQNHLYRLFVSRSARNRLASAFWIGTALCLLVSDRLGAVGFRLPHQDPDAIARGDAFAATADNPSAIYYNPAGITQLDGDNIRMGLYVISADVKYTSPIGATAKTDTSLQPVPQLYYVHSFTNVPISVGLGVYSPYGLSLDWGNNAPFNTVAESGSVTYLCFNPVIAWKPFRTLSIAIGPTINYSQATLKQAIPVIGGQFKFDGDGLDYGFTAGILWQPHPMWSFGVNYHSATTVDYKGNASQTFGPPFPSSVSSSASIDFPQFVVTGISFRPTPDWNLEFDLDWTEWSGVKQITLQGTPFPPGSQTVTLNYQSSFIYEFGVTRQLGNGYFASVGYIYNENSSPDANFNPLIPDADLHLGSIGFGRRGKHWDWTIAYHFAYGERTVSNDSNVSADGTYKTFNNAFNIATTLKF